jgi:hypothetical protein
LSIESRESLFIYSFHVRDFITVPPLWFLASRMCVIIPGVFANLYPLCRSPCIHDLLTMRSKCVAGAQYMCVIHSRTSPLARWHVLRHFSRVCSPC